MSESSLAPPGYFVLDCPNEEELGTFSCPHHGCDGRAFASAGECIRHEVEWHTGPYTCPECCATFAAQPALSRHFCASRHVQVWQCREESCESNGFGFHTLGAYQEHLNSAFHHSLKTAPEHAPGVVADEVQVADSIVVSGSSRASTASPEGDSLCREPCCHRFCTDFKRPSELKRHANTFAHINAIEIGQALQEEGGSEQECERKQQAMRNFECATAGCPSEGKRFSTAHSFRNHCISNAHQTGSSVGEANVATPGSEARLGLHCIQEGCPGFGRVFYQAAGMARHENSAAHLSAKAGQYENGDEAWQKPQGQSTLANPFTCLPSPVSPGEVRMPNSPESPLARKSGHTIPKTPTRGLMRPLHLMVDKTQPPSSKKRLKKLGGQVSDLEGRVSMLEQTLVRLMSTTNLGETQD